MGVGADLPQVVGVGDGKFFEGDLRSEHARGWPLAASVVPNNRRTTIRVVCIADGGNVLVAHGNVLCVMVPVVLERGHPASRVEIPLEVLGLEIQVAGAVVTDHLAKRRQSVQIPVV